MAETINPKIKDGRLEDLIRETAGKFIQLESNGLSLITVTRVEVADRGEQAVIFFTVLPMDKEKAAQDFLKRKRGEFRDYFSKYARRMRRIPFFDFVIDSGEKNRQNIDEISRNS
jgi:ribosome-binding factor A